MGDQRMKSSRVGGFLAKFSSASRSKDPPEASSGQSDSDQRPEQSSREQKPQQAALSPSTTSRRSRILDKLRWRSPSPSPSLGGKSRSNTPDQAIATPPSKSLTVPGSVPARPRSSYSGPSAQSLAVLSVRARPHSLDYGSSAPKTHGPSLYVSPLPTGAGGNIPATPSGRCGSPPSGAQDSSTTPVSAPTIQISHSQSGSIASEDFAPPQTKSAPNPVPDPAPKNQVWEKALEIAKKKLSDNNLPPLDLTNLTSQSAEENMETIVKALNTVQEDDKKKGGKKVIFVEYLGGILKNVEQYTKVVDTAIQSNPQVSALVWAGVWAIMRVRIDVLSLDVDALN